MALALSVQNLTRRFGRTTAVNDVSFEVRTGEIFGLLGPNGSGKSTTLRCALGLLRPSSGRTRVLDTPSSGIHRLAGRVGVALDSASLIDSLSARDNLEYAARLSRTRRGRDAQDVLREVGLEPHASKRARELSLGQGRRLAIARALLGSPELLVLDEPLAGLDTVGVRSMLDLFRRLASEGKTLILSSHRLHEMETLVDRVAVLAQSRLLAQSTLGELCGSDRDHVRVTVDDEERAKRALAGFRIAASETSSERTTLIIEPAGTHAAELNRLLVESGVAVHELRLERRSLQDAFEALLEESAA